MPKYKVEYQIVRRGYKEVEAPSEEELRATFANQELDSLDDGIEEEDLTIEHVTHLGP
jgi:hypothetical protein